MEVLCEGIGFKLVSFVQIGASFICWLEEASTDETNGECCEVCLFESPTTTGRLNVQIFRAAYFE